MPTHKPLDSLEFATIERLSPLLTNKKISPVELVQLFLRRIEALNGRLNAFLTITTELALEQARAAERELLRGRRRGPLHGIPIALKDNIWTRGIRTTAGSLILRDFVPTADAGVARRLLRAGAVLLGKTNLHEFAYGITSENPHYGPTRNPWDISRISGGSSGGSAAAIAAGLCVAAVGTDTGGSIRVPAALCGIVGLKPTFGRVTRHGVVPLALSFDHVGPLTRGAADAAILLGILAGRDPLDPATVARPHEDFHGASARKPRKLRLARPREFFWTQLDPDVRRLTEAALKSLVKDGADLVEVSLPTVAATVEPSNHIAFAEAREFHQNAGYFPSRAAEYGADVRSRLEQGASVRAVDYLTARAMMAQSRAEFESALARADARAIVVPASAIPAPPVGSDRLQVGDAEESVRSALVRLNRPSDFTGLPAISIPCGFTKQGLPVGLQLIGRAFDESTLIAIARAYEANHDWSSSHPPLAALP
jgi:aspartyl-tRNA(Asn)/glutamyl-tRNA(Gln) amidotransferase subunit A